MRKWWTESPGARGREEGRESREIAAHILKEGGLGLRRWGKIKLGGGSRFTSAKLDLLGRAKAGKVKEGVADGAGYFTFPLSCILGIFVLRKGFSTQCLEERGHCGTTLTDFKPNYHCTTATTTYSLLVLGMHKRH